MQRNSEKVFFAGSQHRCALDRCFMRCFPLFFSFRDRQQSSMPW